MHIPRIGFSLALLLFANGVANAQLVLPPQPQVTMGADIKTLRFDWEPVPDAIYYQLQIRPNDGAAYQPVGQLIPAAITQIAYSLAAHLQNWSGMRFRVAACNDGGCTNSAVLNPRPLMLETIGYLKSSNTERDDNFGQGVALSADGFTLAVTAWREDSNATGVNGDQANNLSQDSGAVYVFRRRGNAWHQEAYLKAGTNQPGQYFGQAFEPFFLRDMHATALSADGSILAVAASRENVDGFLEAGVVYVFRRTQDVWTQVARLQAPELLQGQRFGSSLDMSQDGRTIKVMSTTSNANVIFERLAHIFVQHENAWQHTATLASFHDSEGCRSAKLSPDGKTLVSSCGTQSGFPVGGRLCTRKRVGSGGDVWVHVGDGSTLTFDIRQPIALNMDGSVMAVSVEGVPRRVIVLRWTGTTWRADVGLTGPGSAGDPTYIDNWGYDLAFNDTGELLAISHPQAREANAGISPTMTPGSVSLGAVYLYQHNDDTGDWALRNVIKSPRPGFRDDFGLSIALSGSGRTLAVAGPRENSNATGIDGDRDNELAPDSGAAYLY